MFMSKRRLERKNSLNLLQGTELLIKIQIGSEANFLAFQIGNNKYLVTVRFLSFLGQNCEKCEKIEIQIAQGMEIVLYFKRNKIQMSLST
jgi:hypothetical protein